MASAQYVLAKWLPLGIEAYKHTDKYPNKAQLMEQAMIKF